MLWIRSLVIRQLIGKLGWLSANPGDHHGPVWLRIFCRELPDALVPLVRKVDAAQLLLIPGRPKTVCPDWHRLYTWAGNTKGGSITVPLTSCLSGLESAVWQLTIFVFICKTIKSKPVKQEINGTVILTPFVFPDLSYYFETQAMEQHTLKNVNNYLNTNIHSYFETSGGQISITYLNVVNFFYTSVNLTSVAA